MSRNWFRAIARSMWRCSTTVAGPRAAGARGKKATSSRRQAERSGKYFKENYTGAAQDNIVFGGTLTFKEKIGEAHTASLVKKSDLEERKAGGRCFEGGVCGKIVEAHGIRQRPPANRGDVGTPGYDSRAIPRCSIQEDAEGQGERRRARRCT